MKRICLLIILCLTCTLFAACGSSSEKTKENNSETAAAANSGEVQESSESRNEEIIPDEPITIIDNDIVKVNVTRFFREVFNEGTDSEFLSAGFEVEAENKTDEYEVSLYPRDCSLSDRRVIEFAIWNSNSNVPAGKIATIMFSKMNNEDFEDLNALYELEGNMDLFVRDEKYSYPDLGGEVPFSISGAKNAEAAAAEAGKNREEYADVFAAISKNTWLFNGGDDSILNYIDFKESKAAVGQVYFDGNGRHDNGVKEYDYSISDSSITVTTDGSTLDIPYSLDGENVSLGDGKYLSLDQVEKGLQGYWKYSYNSFGQQEGYLLVDNGTLESESAAEAAGSSGYYYYGPYEGSYKLGIGCFETDMFKGSSWFYSIIDGAPVVLKYDHVCVPADGFPGEDGYDL